VADTILLPIIPGTLVPGYCYPSSPQQLLNDFASNMQAQLAGGMAFYNYGSSKPDVGNNAYPWLNTNDMRWYRFDGVWISPNPETSADVRRIFRGDATALTTYDGGDAGASSDRSGPMWAIDHDFDGRSPMGIGDIPSNTPAHTLGLGDLYGEGTHVLVQAELPNCAFKTSQNFFPVTTDIDEGQEFPSGGHGARRQLIVTSGGSDTPHQTVHPIVAVQFIKRTSRLYYTVP
jgi:hypothetical protein